MRKDLGVQPAVFPMPVLMVAAYDENGTVDVMNAAWGMICGHDKIALFIDEGHKTTKNIRISKAFTVSLADKDHMDVADFYGIATGNKMPDKFEIAEIVETENLHAIVGKIVNVSADEKVISDNGKIDPLKLNALIFDQFQAGYYVAGEKVGQAWSAGKALMEDAEAEK